MIKKLVLLIITILLFNFSLHAEYVMVTDVIDGDTIIVDGKTRVQLIGVDAFGNPKGSKVEKELDRKSTEFTTHFLMGKRVELRRDKSTQLIGDKDKWGRTLAYVQYEDGTLFNKEIIEQGYANAYLKYKLEWGEQLKEAEDYAKKNLKGLWYTILSTKKSPKINRVYVARQGSKFYHDVNCSKIKQIHKKRRIVFKDEEEAKKLGFYKDRWCLPTLMKNY